MNNKKPPKSRKEFNKIKLKKAALELSMNFIVITIISLIIITLGMVFVKSAVSKSNSNIQSMSKQFEKEVEKVLLNTHQPVYLYPESLLLSPGKSGVFVVGVYNIEDTTNNFNIEYPSISSSGLCIYYDQNHIRGNCGNAFRIITPTSQTSPLSIQVLPRNIKKIPFMIKTDKNAEKGLYLIKIDVKKSDGTVYDSKLLSLEVK